MVRISDRIWDHVEKIDEVWKCMYCAHVFAKGIAAQIVKCHLAGVGGSGTKFCSDVPRDVKMEALREINEGEKKWRIIMPTSSSTSSKVTVKVSPKIDGERMIEQETKLLSRDGGVVERVSDEEMIEAEFPDVMVKNGDSVCEICRHVYERRTPAKRRQWHLADIGGSGDTICTSMPDDDKIAILKEITESKRKGRKTVPGSSHTEDVPTMSEDVHNEADHGVRDEKMVEVEDASVKDSWEEEITGVPRGDLRHPTKKDHEQSGEIKVEVHDLVEEMSFKMIEEEEEEEEDEVAHPGKYKRLYKKGIETIQAIRLNLSEGNNMNFELDAFSNMVDLRWLKNYGQNDRDMFLLKTQRIDFWWLMRIFKKNQGVFFPYLRFPYWEECPLKSLSSAFNVQNLVQLSLPRSKVERLWSGVQDVVNLKWMDFSRSQNLTEIPDMSKAKSLEHINLENCFNLIRLHPSVQHLNNLEALNLSGCSNLCKVPKLESKVLRGFNILYCNKMEEMPEICGNRLEHLSLTGSKFPNLIGFQFLRELYLVGCPNVTKFPEVPSNLKYLAIYSTSIEELPSSLNFLTRLEVLSLRDNKKLRSISSCIFTLESLNYVEIVRCGLISFIPELTQSLQIETISAINNYSQFFFTLLDCPELDHESLRMTHVFFKLQVGKDMTTRIQGSEIPEWFPPQNVCVGSSVTLQLPPNLDDNCSLTGFAFLVAVEYNLSFIFPLNNLRFRIYDHDLLAAEMEIPVLKRPISSWGPLSDLVIMHSFSLNSGTCQVIREISSGKYYSNPKISFHFTLSNSNYVVKKCGIYLTF